MERSTTIYRSCNERNHGEMLVFVDWNRGRDFSSGDGFNWLDGLISLVRK